jgi:hypothetical protein
MNKDELRHIKLPWPRVGFLLRKSSPLGVILSAYFEPVPVLILKGLQEIEWVISGIIAADKLVDRGFLQV